MNASCDMSTTVDMNVNTVDDGLLTEDEAINFLGLSDRKNPLGALQWLCRSRRLGYVRVGRGIRRFTRADLKLFVEKQRVSSIG